LLVDLHAAYKILRHGTSSFWYLSLHLFYPICENGSALPVLRREHGQKPVAALLTAAARFGANAAVLHSMLPVLLALIAAQSTALRTRLHHRPRKRWLELCLARYDLSHKGGPKSE